MKIFARFIDKKNGRFFRMRTGGISIVRYIIIRRGSKRTFKSGVRNAINIGISVLGNIVFRHNCSSLVIDAYRIIHQGIVINIGGTIVIIKNNTRGRSIGTAP